MYDRKTDSLIKKFDNLSQQNIKSISTKYIRQIQGIEKLIEIQSKIASYFVGLWNAPGMAIKSHRELLPMLFISFHKNFFSFYSAYKLTTQGLFGPARPLMRNIFEALMISKFCYLSDNPTVLKKWDSGQIVYFSNSILKKIINPSPKPFYDFWGIICDQSHATKSAMQFTLELIEEDELSNVLGNFAVLAALLECNYHLLNSLLITPELYNMAKYYISRYSFKENKFMIPELRKTAHKEFKKNRGYLSSEAISLIWAYRRKWDIKT